MIARHRIAAAAVSAAITVAAAALLAFSSNPIRQAARARLQSAYAALRSSEQGRALLDVMKANRVAVLLDIELPAEPRLESDQAGAYEHARNRIVLSADRLNRLPTSGAAVLLAHEAFHARQFRGPEKPAPSLELEHDAFFMQTVVYYELLRAGIEPSPDESDEAVLLERFRRDVHELGPKTVNPGGRFIRSITEVYVRWRGKHIDGYCASNSISKRIRCPFVALFGGLTAQPMAEQVFQWRPQLETTRRLHEEQQRWNRAWLERHAAELSSTEAPWRPHTVRSAKSHLRAARPLGKLRSATDALAPLKSSPELAPVSSSAPLGRLTPAADPGAPESGRRNGVSNSGGITHSSASTRPCRHCGGSGRIVERIKESVTRERIVPKQAGFDAAGNPYYQDVKELYLDYHDVEKQKPCPACGGSGER